MTRRSSTILSFWLALCALGTFAPLASWAAPITVPSDLNVGEQYRLVFVTSTTRDATSTDIADYNAFVTSVANSVPELTALGTTWTAIGSTSSVDARDNTGTNPTVSTGVPIYRLDDTRIADDNADLWDASIAAQLNTLETADIQPYQGVDVWTGSEANGTARGVVYLGSPGEFVGIGFQAMIDYRWIRYDALYPRAQNKHLYAISAELTVVPEPGTLMLAGIAGGALALVSLCRRRTAARRTPSKGVR